MANSTHAHLPTAPTAPGRWSPFLSRVAQVLVRPTSFWESFRDVPVSVGEVMWPHLVVLVLLRGLAGFVGALLQGVGVTAALGQLVLGVVIWIALVWLLTIVVLSLASARGARVAVHDALKLTAYGITPLLVVGMLSVVPIPYITPIADLAAMPYAFYVLAIGVSPMLGLTERRAAGVIGLTLGALLVLWTVLPTLLPLLLKLLAG